MLPLSADGAGATGDTAMSSTQHQLIEQCATDALGILAGKPFPARPSPSESPPDQGHMPAKAGPVTGEPVHPT
ncbi:TPA: hypothetical protein L5U91_002460 [Pseudomonas aeruginosa]|nr:hypothetical protein [Pseudomonas aeruginosa]